LRPDALHRLDDVRARLPEDDQQDGRLAIQQAKGPNVLRRIQDVSHVGQADSGPRCCSDDKRLEVAAREI